MGPEKTQDNRQARLEITFSSKNRLDRAPAPRQLILPSIYICALSIRNYKAVALCAIGRIPDHMLRNDGWLRKTGLPVPDKARIPIFPTAIAPRAQPSSKVPVTIS